LIEKYIQDQISHLSRQIDRENNNIEGLEAEIAMCNSVIEECHEKIKLWEDALLKLAGN
jgi:peptidoglycan hydrolase CwlO-like protein